MTDPIPPRKLTHAEAGHLGGTTTKQRHGADHFARIGKLGGKLGGTATRDKYGLDYYRRIGAKGGANGRKN